MDLSNRTVSQRAMDWFKKEQANKLGQQIPGLNAPPIEGPTIGPYNPTVRDKIANAVLPERPAPATTRLVEGLLGSRGLGTTGVSAADFTPLGSAFGVNEAGSVQDAALAALPMPPAAKRGMTLASPGIQRIKPMELYHASPHDVDKFSTKYINTGEMTQNEGQGLYFAQSPKVADWYFKNLVHPEDTKAAKESAMGKASMWLKQHDNDPIKAGQAAQAEINFLHGMDEDILNQLKNPKWQDPIHSSYVEFLKKNLGKSAPMIKEYDEVIDLLASGKAKPFENKNTKYKVAVDADPKEFINQNASLFDKLGRPSQSAPVNERLRNMGFEKVPDPMNVGFGYKVPEEWAKGAYKENVSPKKIEEFRQWPAVHGEQLAPASIDQMNLLTKGGIPGTSYLDAWSREKAGMGRWDPRTRNFVIGDDERIKIIDKWRQSGLLNDEALESMIGNTAVG